MAKWIWTDAWEGGHEYECTNCGRHVDVKQKGKDLPEECPYCGVKMDGGGEDA